jgi:hypothetical protein
MRFFNKGVFAAGLVWAWAAVAGCSEHSGCAKKKIRRQCERKGASGRPDDCPPSAHLSFESEEVRLHISPGKLEVNALYRFANTGQKPYKGSVGYPVAVTDHQPSPREIVVNGSTSKVRCRRARRCAAVLKLEVPPGQARSLRIQYRQQLKSGRAVYMLTSARRWKEPIKRAEFEVHVPRHYENVKLSYRPDHTSLKGEVRIYRFARGPFRPDRELEVTWKPAK